MPPTVWDLPPPRDDAGAARSARIDADLLLHRVRMLREGVRTLVVSPDAPADERAREALASELGARLALASSTTGAAVWAHVTTMSLSGKQSTKLHKVMGALEPSLLVFVADPCEVGAEPAAAAPPSAALPPPDLVRKTVRATLAKFLLAVSSRTLGVEAHCAVVLVLLGADATARTVATHARAFREVLPTLPGADQTTPDVALRALEAEFAAACALAGRAHSFAFVGVAAHERAADRVRRELEKARDGLERAVGGMPSSLALGEEVKPPVLEEAVGASTAGVREEGGWSRVFAAVAIVAAVAVVAGAAAVLLTKGRRR